MITRAAYQPDSASPGRTAAGRTAAGNAATLSLWAELQADLAQLSTRGTLVIAKHAGHHVHRDEPELIIRAVRQIIDAERTGERASAHAADGGRRQSADSR